MSELEEYYKDKAILVTGGVGSIGSTIVRELLKYNPKVIRVLDNNETGLFELDEELKSELIRPLVGDVRDPDRLRLAMDRIDIIFHAAALKHVPLCEYNPFDAVQTNVIGTQNIIRSAIETGVSKTIFVSTDKAVNPSNVMGATKLLSERLIISANHYRGLKNSIFACVRFGNVLDSRGSVIPVFRNQIKKGGPVTVTEPDMTRFFMSIPNAVKLILKTGILASEGEIFILKMPSIRIKDLAEVLIEEFSKRFGYSPSDIKIDVIGRRPGEKMHEELITETESENTYENEEMFVVMAPTLEITPALKYQLDKSEKLDRFVKVDGVSYSSRDAKHLSKDEILELLMELDLFS